MKTQRRVIPLPRDWPQTRTRILKRWAGLCHVCGRSGATECDHVIPASRGGTDDDANLRPIHHGCHLTKTAREARGEPRRRPAEAHPGAIRV